MYRSYYLLSIKFKFNFCSFHFKGLFNKDVFISKSKEVVSDWFIKSEEQQGSLPWLVYCADHFIFFCVRVEKKGLVDL